jgi:Flp pilus assembly pilin Flp
MVYRWMGRLHATALGLRDERGQGTVEYVGLILLIAGVIGAVVTFGGSFKGDGLGKAIVDKLQNAIEGVGGSGGG